MEKQEKPIEKLEKQRFVFFQIGLVVALSLTLAAFEYKVGERKLMELSEIPLVFIDEDDMPITRPEPPKPPPPPVPQTILTIVDNKVDVSDELNIDVEIAAIEPQPEIVHITYVEPQYEEPEIHISPEVLPEFPGGETAMMNFLRRHLKVPQLAIHNRIQGTVYVDFVVEPNGEITNIAIRRGVGGGLDEEAMRVVRLMPNWKPGRQSTRAVRTLMTLPIRFEVKN